MMALFVEGSQASVNSKNSPRLETSFCQKQVVSMSMLSVKITVEKIMVYQTRVTSEQNWRLEQQNTAGDKHTCQPRQLCTHQTDETFYVTASTRKNRGPRTVYDLSLMVE